MRKSQRVGTKYMPELDQKLDANQDDIVSTLLTPHVRLPETLGAKHHIVCSYPAHVPDAQPVQARGRIVWSRAYEFQPRGPTYLDGASQ